MEISGVIGWRNMDNKMYNPDLKEDFLSTHEENTSHSYSYHFFYSYHIEEECGKDLKEFSENELDKLLMRRAKQTTSMRYFRNFFSVIKTYIDWTIENGYRKSDVNPLSSSLKPMNYKTYIDEAKVFISEQELNAIENMLNNYQDKVILRLLFEGVRGNKYSELLNLKESDIDFENQRLTLHNDKGKKRILNLEGRDRCFHILRGAIKEKIYYAKGGTELKKGKRGVSECPLVETDYVIKNANHSRTEEINNESTINRRIKLIKEITGMYGLTPVNVWQSGMIRKAVELYERDGELTTAHLEEIAELFGYDKVKMGNKRGYNIHNLKEFINPKVIFNLYEIDVGDIKNKERTKIEKLDQKTSKSIKKLSLDERAKAIYEFLHNGTVNEETQEIIKFYGIPADQRGQLSDVTLKQIAEDLKKFNEEELEELNSESEEQLEKIYHVLMNENDGKDVFRVLKTRIGQRKLKEILLKNYQHQCAMCNITHRKLLVASHIKPWAKSSPEERVDPRNAILLCRHHDALFEHGFISLTDKYEIILAKDFDFHGQGIQTNIKFKKPLKDAPSPVFLKEHRQKHGL